MRIERHGSPHIQTIVLFFKHSFQRHTAEVCPTSAQPATITTSSCRLLPTCSSFRSEFPEKLIDNPVWFWFHEVQRGSYLHRRPDAGIRP
jgi:hypothetical protein